MTEIFFGSCGTVLVAVRATLVAACMATHMVYSKPVLAGVSGSWGFALLES